METLSINSPTKDSTLPSGLQISEEVEKRYNVVRSVGEQCIHDDELKDLLAKKAAPVCYDGFEPSGRMHIAQEVIGNSVNGTYAGLRGRTTGAPQNHWFGPAGDPRRAGIGTPEAIKLVWSCHREVIYDYGPVPQVWELPPST